MESETNDQTSTDSENVDPSVPFQNVTTVALGWTLDFLFVSLYRHFKEGKFDEFKVTLPLFEAISESPSLKGDTYKEKRMICAFLARVVHANELDVRFEEDDCVTPLMSAANIWSKLEVTVADENVFKDLTLHLFVQSVALCLEKGQQSSASSTLKWFENNYDLPQNVGVKLTTIVTERDTYHPLLMSLSFINLLAAIQAFLDTYLEKNPSDDLLKEATKMALSSQDTESFKEGQTQDSSRCENESVEKEPKKKSAVLMSVDLSFKDGETQDSSHCENAKETVEKKPRKKNAVLRTKRTLLSTKITEVWQPDPCKKPRVSIRRLSMNEISRVLSGKPGDTTLNTNNRKIRKWTLEQDKLLEDGVERYGQGKWARILLEYDFGGRTGTNLKDRWRILKKRKEEDESF